MADIQDFSKLESKKRPLIEMPSTYQNVPFFHLIESNNPSLMNL